MGTENKKRAKRIARAAKLNYDNDMTEKDIVRYTLIDTMHFASQKGVDFNKQLDYARDMFAGEVADDE